MPKKTLMIQVLFLAFAGLAYSSHTAGAAENAANERVMLYNANCAICHGQAKRGQPASLIQNAINKNTGGMGTLRFLSTEQIRSIAGYR